MLQRIRAYVWEFPVRLTHWVNFLCIIAFTVTGLYIGIPYVHADGASGQHIMGWMRFVHFVAGYAFLMSFLIRLYWSLMGNRYASLKAFIPYTAQNWRDLFGTLAFYTFLSKKPPYAAGHTQLAAVTYLVVFALFAFQIVSGFALYSAGKPASVVFTILGGWLLGVMHLQTIRVLHHLAMYLILVFAMIHVYIAWWMDTVERNGIAGSMFGGYKFITGKEWE